MEKSERARLLASIHGSARRHGYPSEDLTNYSLRTFGVSLSGLTIAELREVQDWVNKDEE